MPKMKVYLDFEVNLEYDNQCVISRFVKQKNVGFWSFKRWWKARFVPRKVHWEYGIIGLMGGYPNEQKWASEAETFKLQKPDPCCPKLQKIN